MNFHIIEEVSNKNEFEFVYLVKTKEKKGEMDMKRNIFVLLLVLGAALLVSCGGSKSATLDEVKSPEMVYGMSAVVGVEESLSGMAINPMSANDGDDEHDQDLQAIEEVTDLDLLMGLMNDDLFTVEEKESDREGYAHLIAIEFNKNAYNFYYNEVLADEEVGEDEVEKEYEITGIIVVDDLELQVVGTKEIESEEDEDEFELELKISIDEDNYTLIKYQTETGSTEFEKEYIIETHVDGDKVHEFKFKFEIEDKELELKVEVKDEVNNIVIKLEIKGYNKDSVAKVKYEIEEGGSKRKGAFTVTVTVNGDKVTYSYE